MKVVFFGTPRFAAEVLSFLLKHHVDVVAVVTRPDKPKGRSGSPVAPPVKTVALAQKKPIPVFQPERISAPGESDVLEPFQADLFVVVAYGEIVKQHLLDMPKLGCINVHASLLPKYRGAAPIQHCLINGETETGVTIMHMVRQMDAGDIIRQDKVLITPDMTFPELEQELCKLGSEALLEVIQAAERNPIPKIPQDHTKATYAAKIELEDCEIQWEKPAQELHNLVRGVTPSPGAWCYIQIRDQKKRLKILTSYVVEDAQGAPGELLSSDASGILVASGKSALRIQELQPEGKQKMNADSFLRGIPDKKITFIIRSV